MSTETYRQVRRAFNVHSVPGLELKGLDAPVDAWLIVSDDRAGSGWTSSASSRASRRARWAGPARSGSSRSGSSTSSTRVGISSSTSSATPAARAGCCATSTCGSRDSRGGGGSAGASHVEQNRANSLTRDVIATRMRSPRATRPGWSERSSRPVRPGLRGGGGSRPRGPRRRDLARLRPRATHARAGVPTEPQSVRPGDRGSGPVLRACWRGRSRSSSSSRTCTGPTRPRCLLDDADRMWRDVPVMVVATTRSSLLEERPRWGSGLTTTCGSLGALSPRAEPWSSSCSRRSTTHRRSSSTSSSTRPRATRSTSRSWSPAHRLGRRRARLAAVADRGRARRPPGRPPSPEGTAPGPPRRADLVGTRCAATGLGRRPDLLGRRGHPPGVGDRGRRRAGRTVRPPPRARPRVRAGALRLRLGPRVPLQARPAARRRLRQRAAGASTRVPPAGGALARRGHRAPDASRSMRRSSPSTTTRRTIPKPPPGTCAPVAGRPACSPSRRRPTSSSGAQLVPANDTRLLFDVVSARENVFERQGDRVARPLR